MCAQWIKKSNPSVIVNELNNIRSQKDKIVKYNPIKLFFLQSALITKVQFNKKIPKHAYPEIVTKALRKPTQNGKISSDQVIKIITSQERGYVRKKSKEFYVRSQISVSGRLPFNSIGFSGSRFFLKFRSIYSQDHLRDIQHVPYYGEYPSDYLPVLVQVRSRTVIEAAISGIELTDTIRGLWNLYINSNQSFRISSGKRQPVNSVRLGPVHTVHLSDGSLASDRYWYEEHYVDPGRVLRISNHAETLKNRTRRDLKKISVNPLKVPTIEGLLRYTRALDHWSWSNCFLELWAVLEWLTDTQPQLSHEITVKRAASLYSDYEYALEIAKHLRDRRNRAVHSTEHFDDLEIMIYELKQYVENLLRFYIDNPFKFKNVAEVSEFLDLPRDSSLLKKKQHLLRSAINFRS